ncbi:hypothetical protein D3C77_511140 [compost metagenome]
MADHVEQPDEAPGPAAAFVVVDHVNRIGVVAQFAEQALQLLARRRQARRGRLCPLGALGIDEACARQVAFGIARGTGQVDQDQLRGIQAFLQVGGLDDQRQGGEAVGHGGFHG